MGEVPVPEVSSINEQQEAGTVAGTAASVHDESDEDMGDHFGGPASPMGGMRYLSFLKNYKILKYTIKKEKLSNISRSIIIIGHKYLFNLFNNQTLFTILYRNLDCTFVF